MVIMKEELNQNPNITLRVALARFDLYLEGQGRSARTVETYDERIRRLIKYFISQGRGEILPADKSRRDQRAESRLH